MERYCSEELGLINPKIILKKIKLNSLFVVNGFPMHLTGRSNNDLLYKSAAQLVLDNADIIYLKKVYKILEEINKSKGDLRTWVPNKFDKVSSEENINLYKKLLNKYKCGVFIKRPGSQIELLENNIEYFNKISIGLQCFVLEQMVKLFSCKKVTSDFSYIRGSKKAGILKTVNKVGNFDSVQLINQSPTGLFQSSIDLKKL